jgi:hypothetical protein
LAVRRRSGALHIAPVHPSSRWSHVKEADWDIKPTTVTNLIRTRLGKNSVGMAVDLVNPSPDIGVSTLGIMPDDDV